MNIDNRSYFQVSYKVGKNYFKARSGRKKKKSLKKNWFQIYCNLGVCKLDIISG